MPEFSRVAAPVFTPTQCSTCMTHAHKDGFVDLITEYSPPYGRLYLCASCAKTVGHVLGMLDAEQAQVLRKRLADAVTEISKLKDALEAEKENKLVTFSTARKLLKADL